MYSDESYWTRRRRLSRRRFLATSVAGVGGAAIIAACGDDDDDDDDDDGGSPAPSATGAAQPASGGRIRVARRTTPPHFDPALNASFEAAGSLGLTMNRLVRPNGGPGIEPGNLEIVPDLATSWEQPDEVTYVFELHPASFHDLPPVDGREVTAEDVKYTFERILDPSLPAPHRSQHERIVRMEASGPRTITITSKEPYSPFLTSFAYPYSGWIVAREAVEEFGDLRTQIIGTGPFMLAGYDPNVKSNYRRHPNFFRAPLPYLDEIEWLYITDAQARQAAFLTGEIDIGLGSAFERADAENAAKGSGGGIVDVESITTVSLIPMTRAAPLDDERVRRAIQRAIDMQQIMDVVYLGEASLAGVGVPPAMKQWSLPPDEIAELMRTDVDEARALLAEAGHADGFDTTIYNVPVPYGPTFVDTTEIVVERLREIGIGASIEAKEYAAHLETWTGENWSLYLGPRGIGFSAWEYLYGQFSPGADRNYSKTDDPRVNDLLARLQRTFDVEEQIELAHDTQRRLAEIMAEIPMPLPIAFAAYHGRVKDYAPSLDYGSPEAQWIWIADV